MPPPDLPSRDQFLATGVEPYTCSICLEPFIWSHHPVQFTGPDSCGHVFGATCIQEWVESRNENANKCPTCCCELFRSETARAEEEEDVGSLDTDLAPDDDALDASREDVSERLLDIPNTRAFFDGDSDNSDSDNDSELGIEEMISLIFDDDGADEVEGTHPASSGMLPNKVEDITLREHADQFTADLLTRLRVYTATYTPSDAQLHIHFRQTCENFGIREYPLLLSNEWTQICSTLEDLRREDMRFDGNSLRIFWMRGTAVSRLATALGWRLER